MSQITVIAHNIRSAHNVGAIFRSSDGFGVQRIYLTGYSPYPRHDQDTRLPHLADKIHKSISKSALGAEMTVPFSASSNIIELINGLRVQGYRIVALEQHEGSQPLHAYRSSEKIALLLGEEVEGITVDLLAICDDIVEIPMVGSKESFNVSVATGIALYELSKPRLD